MRLVVYHSGYGCDTGCCGHFVELEDGEQVRDSWRFDHPYGQDPRTFAEELIRETMGDEHVADLDWENSVIVND